MIQDQERLIFLKELDHLFDEYKNSPNDQVQQTIYEDILLICEALIIEKAD
ncbi:hypothetical protein [Mesobacillus harenae]|uniref:hypothetical protein n=1 Tax=Mesobacillus harenae TaxID=2213203 RepID=UPI00158072EC|nr:hypothetical protein [Mesobacillus harenae]